MFALVRNLFGSNKPVTYLSLIEKAKADYSFYTKLASGSFLAGISSFFSSSSWLTKIPLITGAVFGTSAGIKGIMSSNEEINVFTKAHEATVSKGYLATLKATSDLGSLTYLTTVDKNGVDQFTGKHLEGGKVISNEITRVPTVSLTKDGVGYKHNGGYEVLESTDRVLYKEIAGVPGQYTNKFVLDYSIISMHGCIVQQLMQKGYSNEDIEQALKLNSAEVRENYKNKQIAEYKPSLSSKLWHGTEKAIQNKEAEFSKEIQKYAEINEAYEALFNHHTSNINEERAEEFYSLDNGQFDHSTEMLGNADEGYGTGYDSDIA